MTKPLKSMTKDELIAHNEMLQKRLEHQEKSERVTVNTTLPRSLRDRLRARALGQDVTLQLLIQEAIEDYLAQP